MPRSSMSGFGALVGCAWAAERINIVRKGTASRITSLQFCQSIVERRRRARALVESIEIKLLIGRVNTIVGQAKSDEQRIDAEHFLEQADHGNRTATTNKDRFFAESKLQRLGRQPGRL